MYKKKCRSIKILSCVLALIMFSLMLPIMASAAIYTVYAGNTSSGSPYQIGTWSTYNSYVIEFQPTETVAYLRFNATVGDKLAVVVSERAAPLPPNNCELTVLGPSGFAPVFIDQVRYYNGNQLLPYYVASVDASSTGSYLIQLVRTSSTDEFRAITVTFEQRMATASITVSIPGTASNPGNNPYSSNGSLSSIISVNLSNNTAIPPDAIVRTVRTTASQSPVQGNTWHQISPGGMTWFESTVSSSSTGTYTNPFPTGYLVRSNWQFRYRTLAMASSTMRNVSLIITYEYDRVNSVYI